MAKFLLLVTCIVFYFDSSRSLRASTVRELTGLHSKTNHYESSPTPGGLKDLKASGFQNVSAACQKAIIDLMFKSPMLLAKYADASGRPNSGVFSGNLVWLGSYSTCKTIPDAHYCLAPDVTLQLNTPGNKTTIPFISWGLCVPTNCSEEDVALAFGDINKAVTKQDLGHVTLTGVNCAHPSKWTTGPIITLVVCIIIACLCLTGTVVDLCVVQQSWTFWVASVEYERDSVPRSEEGGLLSNGLSNHSESAPLLSNYEDSSNASSIQIKQPSLKERGFLVNLLVCFSIVRNTSKIMDCSVPAGAITSLNGVRVLSMWWVILGHTYLWLLIYRIIDDVGIGINIMHRFSFQAVNNAFFSVDSFFSAEVWKYYIGLLVAYLSFRRMDKNDGKLPLIKFYFHRFWRLTPSYMFVILFYANLYAFLGEGPLWYGSQVGTPCDKYWWTNLLYINNFYPNSLTQECLGWSWYLANDMQFYVISPILLYLIYRFHWKGLAFGVGSVLQHPNRGSYTDLVYIKPYCRIAPYLVGIALGYLIHVEKATLGKSPLNKIPRQIFALVGWFLAIGLGVSSVYGVYTFYKKDGRPFNLAENVIYGTFSRFVWGLALAWVIYACNKGYGSLVNKFLSASYWIPLSRLTYSAYLVHPLVLGAYFGSFQTYLGIQRPKFRFLLRVSSGDVVRISFCARRLRGVSHNAVRKCAVSSEARSPQASDSAVTCFSSNSNY
ncbi:hypothetical protein OS493_007782 [Desmophyllum pertusum]|uniref:Nose resistant-to-fluoxetine protein N-terminal domain-containing protein n=1 Tax=Desmophyllum pertusum TaxID=174260 RepID=A0A9W9YRZ8_9CNID|nr:hypothetical protein OS493_007782 [Desmophyllum pertusum]